MKNFPPHKKKNRNGRKPARLVPECKHNTANYSASTRSRRGTTVKEEGEKKNRDVWSCSFLRLLFFSVFCISHNWKFCFALFFLLLFLLCARALVRPMSVHAKEGGGQLLWLRHFPIFYPTFFVILSFRPSLGFLAERVPAAPGREHSAAAGGRPAYLPGHACPALVCAPCPLSHLGLFVVCFLRWW